ncbi:MAG: hypothetical protein U1D55_06585 [Phycisphaerae bacterium]
MARLSSCTRCTCALIGIAALATPSLFAQTPLGNAFNYQGRLLSGGAPASTAHDFEFRLFDAASAGVQVAGPVNALAVSPDTSGLFTIESVNLGSSAFDGNERWLQIGVRPAGGGAFTPLSPRQKVNAAPYAGYALNSASLKLPFTASINNSNAALDITNSNGVAGYFTNSTNSSVATMIVSKTGNFGPALLVDGVLQCGSITGAPGDLQIKSTNNVSVELSTDVIAGGVFRLNTGSGVAAVQLSQQGVSGGGLLKLNRDNVPNAGIQAEGNFGSSGSPALFLNGSKSCAFDMRAATSGNASVALPGDAISAAECLDEAGVASDATNTGAALGAAIAPILSRTITAPAAGFAIVLATCQLNLGHTTGTTTSATIGVSNSSSALPITQDIGATIPSTAPSGTYIQGTTVHGVFSVTAGSNTFYFLGQVTSGGASVNDISITVVFVPTAYGTVTPPRPSNGTDDEPPSATLRGPLTAADISTEQAQAAEFDRARLARELAEMKARMQEIERMMQAGVRPE